ncbi:MAG: hypothetical protein HY929_06725 [Euryarchaeota archaeon]|nr:hypothetical protein [Euryarchaeota archaeon]
MTLTQKEREILINSIRSNLLDLSKCAKVLEGRRLARNIQLGLEILDEEENLSKTWVWKDIIRTFYQSLESCAHKCSLSMKEAFPELFERKRSEEVIESKTEEQYSII